MIFYRQGLMKSGKRFVKLPLDFQKFFSKYSENQKWAAPLISPFHGQQAAEIAFERQLGEKSKK